MRMPRGPLQCLRACATVAVLAIAALQGSALVSAGPAHAQQPKIKPAGEQQLPGMHSSALDAELFYQLLSAEMLALNRQMPEAISAYVQAARAHPSDALYERAFRLTLGTHHLQNSLSIAHEWERHLPQSETPKNYLFQLSLNNGLYADAVRYAREFLALMQPGQRNDFILGLSERFKPIPDKVASAVEIKRLLTPYLSQPAHASAARLTIARGAIHAAAYQEAMAQLNALTEADPSTLDGWLLRGTLEVQENLPQAAHSSLMQFLRVAREKDLPSNHAFYAQAYLLLAQLAENKKDFEQAHAWLTRIEDEKARLDAQLKRASILAKQGRLAQGLQLIEELPEKTREGARARFLAQVHLLRDHGQYARAEQLVQDKLKVNPNDTLWLFELATLLERQKRYDEMERVLRQVMQDRPDDAEAYNALGYSLADRGVRLEEAKALIEASLQRAPNNPYITDSLGWVEFRAGRLHSALEILQRAFAIRADAEIGAHIGEVLWMLGRYDEARAMWNQARSINPDNETLLQTMQRLDK